MTAEPAILDDSQLAVVALPVEGRQIVLAGPGAGKTEVVGHLTEQFVRDGIYPDEILVISFSRAALLATTRRTRHIVDEGHRIDLATIDSLAARIVIELDDPKTPFRGFDHTVKRATDLLFTSEWIFPPVAHVVVDEVQDIVGVRARFVLKLLEVLVDRGAGFTLLGDPLQAIYDFQLARDAMSCTDLLDELTKRFGPIPHTLTGEYRTRSEQTRAAATVRASLGVLDPEDRLRRLNAITVDLPPLGVFDADAVADLTGWAGTTALLCDTNIRAALVAERAAELGLRVETAPNRDDAALPAWIGDLLQNHPGPVQTREQFLHLSGAEPAGNSLDRWRLLMDVSRGRRELQLRDLGVALQSVGRTRELERPPAAEVIASTVHRAKGLEFDNVILVDPDQWNRRDDETPDAVSRRMFVALTRARSRLARVRGIDTRGWSRQTESGASVWVKRLPRQGGRGRPTAILLEPWMARALGPTFVDLSGFVGSPITWQRTAEHITVDGDILPSWTAHAADGTPVARTGEAFGQIIAKLADPTLTRLPHLLGGHIEGTETLAGAPASGDLGRHGFWTGARVSGALIFARNTKGPT